MEYGNGESAIVASLVTGFAGKIINLESAALGLVAQGHDVVTYDYSMDVLESGEPDSLVHLITSVDSDFQRRSQGYNICRHAGVSLGMCIAINMQRKTETPQMPAIYAAGGSNVAKTIFRNVAFNLAFGKVRKAFRQNGYNEQILREIWDPLHESPQSSFVIALGGLDLVVKYRDAEQRMRRLHRTGTPVVVKTVPWAGHVGTIEWFNRNIPTMLTIAKTLVVKA